MEMKMFRVNVKLVMVTFAMMLTLTNCSGKVEKTAGMSNKMKVNKGLSSKSENLVNYLLKEKDTRIHFSFVQESQEFGASYVGLLEQMSNPTGRQLNEVTPAPVKNTPTAGNTVMNSMNEADMKAASLKQIMIWLPIVLSIVLFFTVMSLVEMPIQKNSILYAKYGTTKQLQSQ